MNLRLILKNCFQGIRFGILFLFMLGAVGFIWSQLYFGGVSLNQLLFHITFLDMQQIAQRWLSLCLIFIFTICATFLIRQKIRITITFIFLFCGFVGCYPMRVSHLNEETPVPFWTQLYLSFQETSLYDKNYVVPELEQPLPKKSKNIIIIFAESMEKTFGDRAYWGENLIPYLTRLGNRYTTVEGYEHVNGTNWTLASQVAVFCGVPFKTELRDKLDTQTEGFIPGAVCMSDLLKQAGYRTVFAKGAYKEFVGTDVFVTEHHFDEVWGRDELIASGYATEADIGLTAFGVNDRTFFAFARQKVTELSKRAEPFFLSLTTLDTHFPKGYVNTGCVEKYHDIRDAVICSDKIIFDFVEWCRRQPFFKDTVIFVLGDHLMMEANDVNKDLALYPNRRAYNVIINQDMGYPHVIRKPFAQFDWGATILDAANIPTVGRQLGLGVSLLSDTPTLVERYGFPALDVEMIKSSKRYRRLLLVPKAAND